jgi:hypothetical protein
MHTGDVYLHYRDNTLVRELIVYTDPTRLPQTTVLPHATAQSGRGASTANGAGYPMRQQDLAAYASLRIGASEFACMWALHAELDAVGTPPASPSHPHAFTLRASQHRRWATHIRTEAEWRTDR